MLAKQFDVSNIHREGQQLPSASPAESARDIIDHLVSSPVVRVRGFGAGVRAPAHFLGLMVTDVTVVSEQLMRKL